MVPLIITNKYLSIYVSAKLDLVRILAKFIYTEQLILFKVPCLILTHCLESRQSKLTLGQSSTYTSFRYDIEPFLNETWFESSLTNL